MKRSRAFVVVVRPAPVSLADRVYREWLVRNGAVRTWLEDALLLPRQRQWVRVKK